MEYFSKLNLNFSYDINFWDALTASIAIFMAVIAYRQDKKAISLQLLISELQGTFDHPKLEINLFGKDICTDYYLFIPIKKDGPISVPLNFTIINKGESQANDVEFIVSGSKAIIQEKIMKPESKSYGFSKIDTKITSFSDHISVLCTYFEKISHNSNALVEIDPVINSSTDNMYKDDFATKDNQLLTVTYNIAFSYNLNLWLTARNQTSISRKINLHLLDSGDKSVDEYFEDLSESMAKDFRKKYQKLKLKDKIRFRFSKDHLLKKNNKSFCIVNTKNVKKNNTGINEIETYEIYGGFITYFGYLIIPSLGKYGKSN